jgi:hypothetical protein
MRWRRTRVSRVTAGLGVLALACNAAVPIFLAFMLSMSLAPTQQRWVWPADGEWRFNAPLCRHDDNGSSTDDQHGKPVGAPCPVCSLHGVLAVALPAPIAVPAAPITVATAAETLFTVGLSAGVASPGYRSRAPPAV